MLSLFFLCIQLLTRDNPSFPRHISHQLLGCWKSPRKVSFSSRAETTVAFLHVSRAHGTSRPTFVCFSAKVVAGWWVVTHENLLSVAVYDVPASNFDSLSRNHLCVHWSSIFKPVKNFNVHLWIVHQTPAWLYRNFIQWRHYKWIFLGRLRILDFLLPTVNYFFDVHLCWPRVLILHIIGALSIWYYLPCDCWPKKKLVNSWVFLQKEIVTQQILLTCASFLVLIHRALICPPLSNVCGFDVPYLLNCKNNSVRDFWWWAKFSFRLRTSLIILATLACPSCLPVAMVFLLVLWSSTIFFFSASVKVRVFTSPHLPVWFCALYMHMVCRLLTLQ